MEEVVFTYWHWLVLGVLLMAAEIVVPGVYLLWIGIAGLLTGVLAYILPDIGWQYHAIFFAVVSVASAVAGRRLYGVGSARDVPFLNRRGTEFIGQIHTLDTPIENGAGRIRVADTYWRVLGPDLPAGTRVRVVSLKGSSLVVEKAEGA